jgi:hypothetical protein
MTHKQIAALIKITERQVNLAVSGVRDELVANLVTPTFSIRNINRQTIQELMSEMVRDLHCQFDDQIATIWDGTNSYIQKSLDNKFQRLTWCGYKGRHCVKPMFAIAGDGKIIDIFGPYPATDGDTVIIRKVLGKYDNDFKRIFEAGDVFIVNRGFQFARKDLEERQYIVAMPTCQTDRKQN